MEMYVSLAELKQDLDYFRNNPEDAKFFDKMLDKYKNSSDEVKTILKSFLCDKMLEDNPTYLLQKIAEENPEKIVYCNTPDDPFFMI
jgi:hypothetical protein